MTVCERMHEEIVFMGRHCPLCEMMGTVDSLEDRITSLEGQVNEKDNAG